LRVLVIENFPGTPLGILADVLGSAGIAVEERKAFLGAPVPEEADAFAGLIVLGGGQSALDDADHSYLPAVARLTQAFTWADRPVLGICLGAQLLARGAGARNILGRPIEFGWHEVRPTTAGRSDPLLWHLGDGAPVFHWHTDTVTLPHGAVHLAESDMTRIQAFRIGRATYGIQFHFEADRKLVGAWSRDLAESIAEHTPGWPIRHAADAARLGEKADAAGRAIAAAWVRLLT
jgi:GMP synthase-like glutamine amidotransferase